MGIWNLHQMMFLDFFILRSSMQIMNFPPTHHDHKSRHISSTEFVFYSKTHGSLSPLSCYILVYLLQLPLPFFIYLQPLPFYVIVYFTPMSYTLFVCLPSLPFHVLVYLSLRSFLFGVCFTWSRLLFQYHCRSFTALLPSHCLCLVDVLPHRQPYPFLSILSSILLSTLYAVIFSSRLFV